MSGDDPSRRRSDPSYDAEASFIKKALDNPLFTRAIQMLVAAAIGAAAGGTTHQVADADQNKVVQENRATILELKQEIAGIRDGFAQRVKVEEQERETDIRRLRDRVLFLEAKTGHALRGTATRASATDAN